MRRLWVVAPALVLSLTLGAAVAQASTTTYAVLVNCTSSGQLCDPPFVVGVATAGVLQVEFTASTGHCSDIRVHLFVDGVLKHTSAFLGPGVSTGAVDLGPVTPGAHSLGVQAEGRVGGCNFGRLGSWGGTLTVVTSEPRRDTTPPAAECTESTNPAGKTVPPAGSTTLPGARGGQNEDGFYQLIGTDNVAVASIVIRDGASSFVSQPFASGDRVKVTQAPGATPGERRPGPGVIVSHLTLKGDAILRVTDTSGNVAEVACALPPPPK